MQRGIRELTAGVLDAPAPCPGARDAPGVPPDYHRQPPRRYSSQAI